MLAGTEIYPKPATTSIKELETEPGIPILHYNSTPEASACLGKIKRLLEYLLEPTSKCMAHQSPPADREAEQDFIEVQSNCRSLLSRSVVAELQ